MQKFVGHPYTHLDAPRNTMKTVLRIFWRDLKRILRNPVALIVTLGVCIIPSLYAWFNILANWDPYANTSDIAVAVVNKDAGAQAGSMGYVNAGDMVEDKLRENTQLGWTFPDEDDGMEGVKSGRYYATIVIPEDFTASLADVLDGDTQKADLDYYVNEKANPVAPKVTDTGADTIEQQIDDTFAGTVSQVIAERVADGSAEALGSLGSADDTVAGKVSEVQASLDDLKGQLDGTVDKLGSVRTTVSQTSDTLGGLADSSDRAAGDLRQTLDTLAGTRVKVRDTTKGLSGALAGGIGTLAGVSATASTDIGTLAGHVTTATGRLDSAVDEVEAELAWTGTISAQLDDIRTLAGTIEADGDAGGVSADVSARLESVLGASGPKVQALGDQTDALSSQLQQIKSDTEALRQGARDVAGLSGSLGESLSSTSSTLAGLQSDVSSNAVPQIDGALDSFSDAGNGLQATLASLGPTLRQTQGILSELDATIQQAQATVQATSDEVGKVSDDMGGLADDLGTIRSSELWDTLEKASQLDPEGVGGFMNAPVELADEPVFPVENYGSGVTPFYTNLALWVGGFVLVAIYKLEVDREDVGDFRPWQGYLGRWMLLNLLGLVQAVVCCVGDIMLGIQCVSPVAFVFAGVVEAFAYVGFVYALSIAFKHIGKALGVLIIVLQIPGASGTYPVEMMLPAYRALSPWLPFTYGINAMREAIAGFYDGYYAYNLAMLLLLLVPISLLIGMVARRHLLNINTLFDRKLAETDLMISERVPAGEQQFKLSTIVKVILNSDEYSEVLVGRAAKFELMYPVLVKRGFWALIVVPVALLILLFVVDAKFVFLMLWVLSLVVICTFLIVVEYLHSRLNEKTELASLSQDQLLGLLDDKLRDELFAFAPIEKLRLTHETLGDRLRRMRSARGSGGWRDASGTSGATGDDGHAAPSGADDTSRGAEDGGARATGASADNDATVRLDTPGIGTRPEGDAGMHVGDTRTHWTIDGTQIRRKPRDERDGGSRDE